jgi:hypothetical protein
MCMEPLSTMTLSRCYKATVNEPETITEAQPFYAVDRPQRVARLWLPVSGRCPIERS